MDEMRLRELTRTLNTLPAGAMMIYLLFLAIPIAALLAWAAVFDRKRLGP
jgi:hypothetical protein